MKPTAEKTPVDLVVIALSPLLIMAMVGSLVFFLVEVLYVGQYQSRLLWCLFFYVCGAVLVARISIELDGRRATMYGLVLGGAAWLGMLRFVEYPAGSVAAEFGWAIHIVLIGIVWWCTHRLTWDCTMIDDTQDASGSGLLQAAGIEEDATGQPATAPSEEKKPRRKSKDSPLQAWWGRYRRYREECRRKPHVPGVWVVYFSLAALPLYGLGQALIPSAETDRRRYVFWLMGIYVASGLGLLLTTSFLGLRRYLRQKSVKMPIGITSTWLLAGAAMIMVFLVLGALLPRPAAEYALIDLPWRAGASERAASHFAKQGDDAGKDEGRPTGKGKDGKDGGGKDAPSRKDKADKDKDGGAAQAKDKASSGGADGKDKAGEKGTQKDKQAAKDKKGDAPEKGDKKKADEAKGAGKGDPDKQDQAGQQAAPPPPPPSSPDWLGLLAQILKWIVIGAFILVIGFVLLRSGLRFLANFTTWAKNLLDFFHNLWQRLFAARSVTGDVQESGAASARPRPFRSFPDPFLTGEADHMSPAELVRYTFEALQSWAAERDLGRRKGETPVEFAERISSETANLREDVRLLANYYAGLAYAGQRLSDECRDPLRQLWLALADAARPETVVH